MREASVFAKEDYHDFFAASLPYYTAKFAENKNEFPGVYRILEAKQKSFARER